MSSNADEDVSAQLADEIMQDDAQCSRASRFTEEQRLVLDQWMAENHFNPYPAPAVKEQLAQATDLSMKQIQQYFSNYRRRHLEKSQLGGVASIGSMRGAHNSSSQSGDVEMELEQPEDSPGSTNADAPGVSIEARPPSRQFNRSSNSPSLEQSNSPDEQGCTTENQGLAAPSLSESDSNLLEWWLRVHCDCTTDSSQWKDTLEMPPPSLRSGLVGAVSPASAPSIATRDSTKYLPPTTMSVRSANNSLYRVGSSVYSLGTRASRGSRRGRRAYGSTHAQQHTSSNVNTAHKCEECGNTFATGWTLKRHVQSVHESNERWVCAPVVTTAGSFLCPTCSQDPLGCCHGMLPCWEKPEEQRTFYRKDSLKQHLKLVHDFECEPRATDGDTLALLGMHQSREGPYAIVLRIGAQLVKAKSACSGWALRQHGFCLETFDACWAQSLRREFALGSNTESTRGSADEDVTEYCQKKLRDVVESCDARG